MDDFTDRRVVRVGVLAVVMLVWLAPDATAARATPALGTITVNTLADNETPGDGFCTLREAIDNANSDGDFSGGDCKPGSPLDFIGFSVSGTIAVLGPGAAGPCTSATF